MPMAVATQTGPIFVFVTPARSVSWRRENRHLRTHLTDEILVLNPRVFLRAYLLKGPILSPIVRPEKPNVLWFSNPFHPQHPTSGHLGSSLRRQLYTRCTKLWVGRTDPSAPR